MVIAPAPPTYTTTAIPAILEHRFLSLRWLARRMDIRYLTVWRVINGERPITPAFVEAACRALDLPEEVLFS
jgi:plasmid maintenance system antidote protein VapI